MPYRWVLTRSETRICTTILDRASGTITELVENGRPLAPQELDRFRSAYAEEAARAEVVVLIGSLPAGTPESFYRELVQRTPCPAVLDFRGEGLLGVLDLKPYVVKPNREELARTVGRPLESDESLLGADARAEPPRGRVGRRDPGTGAGLCHFGRKLPGGCTLRPPRPLVNPIGSGDALAATIAWATRAGRPLSGGRPAGLGGGRAERPPTVPCRLAPSAGKRSRGGPRGTVRRVTTCCDEKQSKASRQNKLINYHL